MRYLPALSKANIRITVTSVALITVAAVTSIWLAYRLLNSPLPQLEINSIVVNQGSSLTQVSRELKSKGLFDYPILFNLLARMRNLESSIQSGEYELDQGITASQLLDKMVTGDTVQYRVTLVEGWTFQQALEAIHGSEHIERQLVNVTDQDIANIADLPFSHPEGSLFPDTYFYQAGSSDVDIVKRASAKLQQVLEEAWDKKLGALPYEDSYQALIMASIIEKESAASSERGHISGVFVRRLELGMRLQSDPTVIYGLGDAYDGDIKRADLRSTTPYNTYRIDGLPPTPIALAGLESIHASLNPEESDYLYFVAQGDGSHYFSSNLEEHNAAVARLLNSSSSQP